MTPPLIERLAAHRTLASVPRAELEWLAAAGVERVIEPGGILTPSTGPVKGMYVVLDGHLLIRVDRGAGPRIVMEWHGGDVTGILPYSRIKAPPGNVVAEEATTIFAVDPGELPRMIRECPALTAVLVHVMVDRARVFKSSELLDEKMASLGRLAAGLAHELNNPASAVARSARTLGERLASFDAVTRQFCALPLSETEMASIAEWRARHTRSETPPSAIEAADRLDAIESWLNARRLSGLDLAPMIDAGFDVRDLDALEQSVGASRVGVVLSHEAALGEVRQLTSEIETAATRIHSLVAAVKGFTYMNQQATLQPIAIGRGIADTVTVLRAKARAQSVTINVEVPTDLPAVDGYGGELNQVWANLIDNAIDAAPHGRIIVNAAHDGGYVVVRVIDSGHGIPAEIASRIFDPFFTTKDVGHGTGLGLDIARRIVQRHRGMIDMTTSPQGTEFRVTLPVSASQCAPDDPARRANG